MTEHQLGRREQAQAALEQLRKVVTAPDSGQDEEVRILLLEAEELLAGKEKS